MKLFTRDCFNLETAVSLSRTAVSRFNFSAMAIGVIMSISATANAVFLPPIVEKVNAINQIAPYKGPFVFSSNNNTGDAFDTYVDALSNTYYGVNWAYLNPIWNLPEPIVEASTVSFDPAVGSFVNAISKPSLFTGFAVYKAVAWTDAFTLLTMAGLDTGEGFIPIGPVPPLNQPDLFNILSVGVNFFGQVGVLSYQNISGAIKPEGAIYFSIFDPNTGVWTQRLLMDAFLYTTSATSLAEVCVDPAGNFQLVWSNFDIPNNRVNLFASTFDVTLGTLKARSAIGTIHTPDAVPTKVTTSLAIAPSFATITSTPSAVMAAKVVLDFAGYSQIYALTFINGAWSQIANLTPGPLFPATEVSAAQGGNTYGLTNTGLAQFAVVLQDGGVYTLYSVLQFGVEVLYAPIYSSVFPLDLARADIDAFSNAAVIWREDTGTEQIIAVSTRSGLAGEWQPPEILARRSSSNVLLAPDYVNLTNSVSVVARYNISNPPDINTVTRFVIRVGIDVFNPQGAATFEGVALKNKFATQTDLMNHLTWTASTDPTVVGYQLYRNGALIATFPATGPFKFTDHNREKCVTYTYQLVSFNAAGLFSLPSTVVLTD